MKKKTLKIKAPAKKKVVAKKIKKVATKKTKKVVGRIPALVSKEKLVGKVTHFYTHLKVAIVKFKQEVRVASKLHFKGATTDFSMVIGSLQYNHKPINKAPKGKQTGLKVTKRVREGDLVFLEKQTR